MDDPDLALYVAELPDAAGAADTCRCRHCHRKPNLLVEDYDDSKACCGSAQPCITRTRLFEACLDEVAETYPIVDTNKQRYECYRAFVNRFWDWNHDHPLCKGIHKQRSQLYACVKVAVRERFPAPDDVYRGHRNKSVNRLKRMLW